MTEKEITEMKKEKFKNIVKKQVRISALQYLKQLQQNHSKVNTIQYSKLELVVGINIFIFWMQFAHS